VSGLDDTPSRLVAAAEHLFAEGGEEATSLRAVTREAISNAAAVHYHFGGRDGLLRAVLDRHLGPRQERRLRLLGRAADQYGDAVPVAVVLTAVLRPDLELLAKLRRQRVHVARFVGRAYGSRSPVMAHYLDQQFQQLAERVVPMLAAAAPAVPTDELRQRLRLVLDAVAMRYATTPDPSSAADAPDDVDLDLARLVSFTAAGMVAPGTKAAKPKGKRRKG
jgi:AcrR family transcriptional regulator